MDFPKFGIPVTVSTWRSEKTLQKIIKLTTATISVVVVVVVEAVVTNAENVYKRKISHGIDSAIMIMLVQRYKIISSSSKDCIPLHTKTIFVTNLPKPHISVDQLTR